MSELPSVTGKQAIKAFQKVGFSLVRIQGSHHILKKVGHPNLLTVPVHKNKPLKKGTLRSLISATGLTVDQFSKLLDR